jgi:DNA-3-methyladenine glycosylase
MERRRNTDVIRKLTSGPGRLCEALGIDLSYNGERIGRHIKVRARLITPDIAVSRRIGISKDAHLEWRFCESGNSFVSK